MDKKEFVIDTRKYRVELLGFITSCSMTVFFGVYYAQIFPNYWYTMNILFWGLAAILHNRVKDSTTGPLILSLIGLALVITFILRLPKYSPNDAAKAILDEHIELTDIVVRNTSRYAQLTDHYTYLMVFETEPLTAFLFDAYTGDYEEFDVQKEFPFIQ